MYWRSLMSTRHDEDNWLGRNPKEGQAQRLAPGQRRLERPPENAPTFSRL